MFYLVELDRKVELHPRYLGKDLRHYVQKQVDQVAGRCIPPYGFVVMVLQVKDVGQGQVFDGTFNVTFQVKFSAIVCRPFRNEVVDAVVTSIAKVGITAQAGPFTLFVSPKQWPKDFEFEEGTDTTHRVVSQDRRHSITVNDAVRVRVIGVRVLPGEMNVVGSINENYLGPISQ